MSVLLIVLTLLSIASSLVVFVGSVISTVRATRRNGGRAGSKLDHWQRLQLCVCVLDAVLLVAVAPLFVAHARQGDGGGVHSIWDTAFESAATTFATATVLVLRPVAFAAVAASLNWKRRSNKRLRMVSMAVVAVVIIAGIATIAAVRCSSVLRGSASCATAPTIKTLIVTTQIVFAACATALLAIISSRTSNAKFANQNPRAPPRPSTITPRAPSLSLLIHTQPDPWTRHIDLDSPLKTEFGLQRPHPSDSSVDYGPKLVRGILGEAAGSDRTIDAATASVGYASAVASSNNPYHLGSAFSLGSRDALNSLAAASRIDLAAGAGHASRYAASTRKSSAPFQGASLSSRTPSPGFVDDSSRPISRLSGTATEELLLNQRANSSRNQSDGESIRSKTSWLRLAACLASLWWPIALSSTAVLVKASSGQTFILLSAFCFPATMLLVQELALGCSKRRRPAPTSDPIPRIQHQDTSATSPRSSIASSAVVVYDTPDTLRNRRPHLRSRSCPLESELNGYDHSLLGWNEAGATARQRQSLSSAKSVPYLGKHWTAGKISGDRVVAPRSSFVRGLNLMLNPKPRLEVLPCAAPGQDGAVRAAKARNSGARQSLLPTAVASAVVEGLLEAPHVQGHWTADSERTCITQCYGFEGAAHAVSSLVSLHFDEAGGDSVDAVSRQMDLPGDTADEQSPEVILDMDDTPGSPRLLTDIQPLTDHTDLQSPTKRQATAPRTPKRPDTHPAASPSFSSNDDSQVMGNSASRLFSEIMDILRGNGGHSRIADHRGGASFNQSLRRSPPKGYASIDGESSHRNVSKYDSATEDCDTIVIHSLESSCDFRTAASIGGTQNSISQSLVAAGDRTRNYDGEGEQSGSRMTTIEHDQAEVELVRKGSTSSTLSFSSISSRIRSLRRAASVTNVTPAGSPSSRGRGEQQVKKIRSRTFASAFGIELGMLSRNTSKGRRDTPGSHVDSSPSTSAGTCPSSLMDLSFSPSPAAPRQNSRVFGEQQETPSPNFVEENSMKQGARKAHRRNLSRADSIMDMLDDEHGDTIEEMLDTVNVGSCASEVDEASEGGAGAWNGAEGDEKSSLSEHFEADFDGEAVGFDEIDLADMTMHDTWERCIQQNADSDEALRAFKHGNEEVPGAEEGDYDLMGFDPRRLARAPFLDTVEEEPEDEQVAEESEKQRLCSAQEQTEPDQDSPQAPKPDPGNTTSNDVLDASSSSKLDSNIAEPIGSIQEAAGASRESLLLEREAEQLRVSQLLMEHEVMFPHKTLSRIEEVTELATTLRTSGFRTSSAASGSKLVGDKTASTADASSMRLGLPLSLACQQQESKGDATPDPRSTDSVDGIEGDSCEDRDEGQEVEERQLPFVTPRSRMRRRAAAGRKAAIRSFIGAEATSSDLLRSPEEKAQVDPSPRSRSVRLGQLGMDQGIWMQSPIKLPLQDSSATAGDASRDSKDDTSSSSSSSFQLVDVSAADVSGPSTRLRRSLTLTRSNKTGAESKATTTMMRKLVRLDHQDSPKRELRNRLARTSNSSALQKTSLDATTTNNSPHEKRLLHKPIKKRRKSRIKGVAVMIARHQFTVVDEDDSLIQRYSTAAAAAAAAQPVGPSDKHSCPQ